MADGLAAAGARVAILGRRHDAAAEKADQLRQRGGEAIALEADVLDDGQLRSARSWLLGTWGRVDILVNAAGGNVQRARTDSTSIFAMPVDAFDEVVRLNLHGTVLPTLAFGEAMAEQRRGAVVNVSSMASYQALSGVMGYSVAKAAIENFTRWMAVEMARKYGDQVRVNAIAPGFFVSDQNRGVLVKPDGSHTDRARKIIARTPMARFGVPEELNGAVQWLCSDAAAFVTGVVIPIDGGFSAFSGV